MAGFEHKPNTGNLHKSNTEKEKAPEYTGSALIDGKEKDLSAYIRTSQRGKKYFHIIFKEPYVPQEKNSPPEEKKPINELNDEIPF